MIRSDETTAEPNSPPSSKGFENRRSYADGEGGGGLEHAPDMAERFTIVGVCDFTFGARNLGKQTMQNSCFER